MNMEKDEILNYWKNSSENDFHTVEDLLNSNNYTWALFISHIVIEKLLKAYYVKYVDVKTPYMHDLNRIAEKASLKLTEDQCDFLDLVSTFNIRARYDDYREEFNKKCTREFTFECFEKIKEFRKWIKQML